MENKFFSKAKQKAARIAGDKGRLKSLLSAVGNKIGRLDIDNRDEKTLFGKLALIVRMVLSFVKGQYQDFSLQSRIILVAVLLYFVMPLDLLPDFIPVTGFIDDLTVALWALGSLKKEVQKFKEWEASRENPAGNTKDVKNDMNG